ncbi:MAG: hypothetical protein AABZ45_08370 [Pseudomonadota bacterium]
MTANELAQLGASIIAILFIAWLAMLMGLGGDVRIGDEEQARRLANEAVDGFIPVEVGVDRAGMAALLKDVAGRHLLLRRHGNKFVGRLLDSRAHMRLDRNFLTIGTGERLLAPITLDLGQSAQIWASGMRVLA